MLHKIVHYGLYILVLTLPVTFKLHLFVNDEIKFYARLPLGDIMIFALFVVWLIERFASKSLTRIKLSHKLLWLFLFVAVLSTAYSNNLKGSIKEIAQVFNYYILAYMLFINNVKSSKHLVKILSLLAVITASVAIHSYYQYIVLGGRSYLLSSVFDDRHVLSGFLLTMLPLQLGLLLIQRKAAPKILICISIVAALGVITSIPAYIISCAVLTGMLLHAGRPGAAGAVPVAFIIVVLLPFGLQINHFKTALGGFYEPEGLDNYHKRVTRSVEMTHTPMIGVMEFGKYTLEFSSKVKTEKSVPREYSESIIRARSKDDLYTGRHLNQRILEHQAALNLSGAKPLLGVGIGNYQSEIGYYYQSFPKLNTMEPNTQNGYLVILATMGFTGLGVFMWILLGFWKGLRGMLRKNDNPALYNLTLGTAGSFIAFSLYNIFCPLVNQTAVIFFVLVLAFIAVLKELQRQEKISG